MLLRRQSQPADRMRTLDPTGTGRAPGIDHNRDCIPAANGCFPCERLFMSAIDTATLLYEYTVNVTAVNEFGVGLADLALGQVPPPPEGARIDVSFEGAASGPRIAGHVKGTDYLCVRADGRFDLHIHG